MKLATGTALLMLCLCAFPASAETLQVPEDAAWWLHLGAAIILIVHIAGGAIGILTGWVASTAAKGKQLHRLSGRTFVVAMFASYLVAMFVAPFLDHGARPNTVAAVLALYLLVSGVYAARQGEFAATWREKLGLAIAAMITGAGIWFAIIGFHHESGTVDGSPPQAFALFIVTGIAALIDEIRVLVKGTLTRMEMVRRHLWRMSASFFIASASFFVGQPQVFPDWFNATPLPFLLSFSPLILMAWFLFRYRDRTRLAPSQA